MGREYPEEIQKWWKKIGEPKFVVAPMVDASELPLRFLSRKYGAQLCYTPMFHSRLFVQDPKYRNDHFFSSQSEFDRPLIVQFCGNDPKIIAAAALLVKDHCDAVEINLGCPQAIAKRGHYGAYLQNEWELVASMVREIRSHAQMPVTCKIRRFDDVERTKAYAKTIIDAGCFMLTLHGRTILQKGPLTGIADWNHIKQVREVVNIPMLANGNIQYLEDVHRCIEETGVDGVMSAEGNLHNPALFHGINPPVWQIGLEYLDFVKEYPCPMSYTRGHLFKLYQHLMVLDDNAEIRTKLAKAYELDHFYNVAHLLKEKYEPYLSGEKQLTYTLPLAPWLCQPYVRPPPAVAKQPSNPPQVLDENLSNNKKKRLDRNPKYKMGVKKPMVLCKMCVNPPGLKCDYKMCKHCCRSQCHTKVLDCIGHKCLIKTRTLAKDNLQAKEQQAFEKKADENMDTFISDQ